RMHRSLVYLLPPACRILPDQFFNFSLSLSASMAINSELVGLPRSLRMVYRNILLMTSSSLRSHAVSMAWRMALSTRLGVVSNFMAISGYRVLVMLLRTDMSSTTMAMAKRRYW